MGPSEDAISSLSLSSASSSARMLTIHICRRCLLANMSMMASTSTVMSLCTSISASPLIRSFPILHPRSFLFKLLAAPQVGFQAFQTTECSLCSACSLSPGGNRECEAACSCSDRWWYIWQSLCDGLRQRLRWHCLPLHSPAFKLSVDDLC